MERTLSLDASTTCIGWSVWDKDDLISYGKITPTIKKLEWRDRLRNFTPQICSLIKDYKITNMIIEDVPLMKKGGLKTLVQLGAVQGMVIGICDSFGVELSFKSVADWRKDIGLHDGTKDGMKRDLLKQYSIEKANKMFGLQLTFVSASSTLNDDDISDSILLYASTRDKYKVVPKTFGRKRKVVDK
jgi:Holliday junction resolvasome RuvABC endonuclease subunit